MGNRRNYQPYFLAAGFAALIALPWIMSVPGEPPSTASAQATSVSGWDQLGDCSDVTALNGERTLTLHADGTAVTVDTSVLKPGNFNEIKSAQGRWEWQRGTQRYTVTLDGESTQYALVTVGAPATCMLIRGDVGSADLRGSWFASQAYRLDADE